MSFYFCYHKHTDYSLIDSCTNYQDYIDYEVSLGHKATAFTEHGKPSGWVKKKMYCDSKGIKYIHGVECYLTESLNNKVRDNYHTVLLAKNYEGVKEINDIISRSTDKEHFYYVNRITFDEFFALSDNIIKISACLASPLNKFDKQNPLYEKLAQAYDYYEVQYHNCPEQKEYNQHLFELSQKYGKKLIAATDTHSLNSYKAECRKMMLIYKGKSYGNEDDFDLTYKTYDELVRAFKVQNALPENIFLEAIEETNKLADSIEDFDIDTKPKYPILYGTVEEDNRRFVACVQNNYSLKLSDKTISSDHADEYTNAINEEMRVFQKLDMCGFMLSMSELITWCKNNNIPVGTGRGSVCGSTIAYLTNVTDVDPIIWNTVFSRFANEDRQELGDIDIDVIAEDRPRIFEYIIGRFGTEKTARVPSYGTMADKAVIDGICNALAKIWSGDYTGKHNNDPDNPYNLTKVKQIKKEYEANPDKAKSKYKDVFYYFDGMLGTKISQSVHPAGMVISPITLSDHYGTFDKDDENCLIIDMDECHDVGLVKYDFLILKTLGVIADTCKLIGTTYPKAHEINWDDQAVWADMSKNPSTIFQMESEFASKSLRQFKPTSIFDMSLVTASLRPSGASYRDDLLQRKVHKNPSDLIDNLLAKDYGYLVYQESIIAFLQQICGLSGSEADTVRRGIAKKKMDILEKWLPKILDGYCSKSDKPRAVAENEAKDYLKVIEDASAYMFGLNHSIAYCMLGYYCAYYRYYHPLEYITAYLNNAANEDDIINGTELAKEYGIQITAPRFGESAAKYMPHHETNTISKGIATVKYLNESVSDNLYAMSQKGYQNFLDILQDINFTGANSRQINVLVKIGYFSKFGNMRELLKTIEMFDYFKGGAISSIKCEDVDKAWWGDIAKEYASNIGKNGNVLKTYKVWNGVALLREVYEHIMNMGLNDLDDKLKMAAQKEYLGYVDLTTGREEDRRKLLVEKVVPLKKQGEEPWGYAVFAKSVGSGKASRLTVRSKIYDNNPLKAMNIIYAEAVNKNKSGYWYLTDYQIIF